MSLVAGMQSLERSLQPRDDIQKDERRMWTFYVLCIIILLCMMSYTS